MRWAGHAAHVGKNNLTDLHADGRSITVKWILEEQE
jgi:hypothetical protein